MFTEKQQNVFDVFLHMIKDRQYYLLSSHERATGKTFCLQELSLTLMALGYKVFILTPSRWVEYFADGYVSEVPKDFRGKLTDNSVIIVDETRFNTMDDILDYCEYRRIPVIGYVNFGIYIPDNKMIFEKEYKCEWIG